MSSVRAVAERIATWAAIALCGVGIGWGLCARVVGAERNFLFGDEFHSLRLARLSYTQLLRTYEPNGSGLALPLLQRLAADTFGLSHWSLRWPALLGSLGTLIAGFWLARRGDGVTAALGVTLLWAASPFQLFYGHFGRIYALAGLGMLLLLWAGLRLATEDAPSLWRYLVFSASAAVLPVLHLATASLVVSVGAALTAWLAVQGRLRPRAWRVAAALGLAAAACALSYAPAWASLLAFVRAKAVVQQSSAPDAAGVLLLLGSGRVGAAVLLAGAVLALAATLRGRDILAVLQTAGIIGPPLALALLKPYGDAFAYARYLLPSALLAGWAVCRGLATLAATRSRVVRQWLPLGPGLLVVCAAWFHAPAADGPYGNTYLALQSLPAYDAPWPGRSAFYASVGCPGGETIIETPALLTRARDLHRNAYLASHCQTLLGFFPEEAPLAVPRGPYVLLERDALLRSGAKYLVAHRDIGAEARRYRDFVRSQSGTLDGVERALFDRRQLYYGPLPRLNSCLLAYLRRELGSPVYEDSDILAWDLRVPPTRRQDGRGAL